jgi:hypothetical protein
MALNAACSRRLSMGSLVQGLNLDLPLNSSRLVSHTHMSPHEELLLLQGKYITSSEECQDFFGEH